MRRHLMWATALVAALLPLTLSPPRASAGTPSVLEGGVADVGQRGFRLYLTLSEEAEVEAAVSLDEAGARPAPGARVDTSPFARPETAERAEDRGLAWVSIGGLIADTPYYVRLTLISGSTQDVALWPSDGPIFVRTAASLSPSRSGSLSLAPTLTVDVSPPEGSAAGSLGVLRADEAAYPLSTFAGEGEQSGALSFDAMNLLDGAGGALRLGAGTPLRLTHVRERGDRSQRGYRFPANLGPGAVPLAPYTQSEALPAGWSLFALWVEPEDASPSAIFGDLQSQVQALYCEEGGAWEARDPASSQPIPLGRACAVRLTQGGTLSVAGPSILDPITRSAGESSAVLSLSGATSVEGWLSARGAEGVSALWTYDNSEGRWRGWHADAPPGVNDLNEIVVGRVYILTLDQALTVEVE